MYAPGADRRAHDVAALLAEHGYGDSTLIEATRDSGIDQLMPLQTGAAWTAEVAQLLKIGGYDTWSPDLVANPLPAGTTDIVYLTAQVN